jgi:hypothetical protein
LARISSLSELTKKRNAGKQISGQIFRTEAF